MYWNLELFDEHSEFDFDDIEVVSIDELDEINEDEDQRDFEGRYFYFLGDFE